MGLTLASKITIARILAAPFFIAAVLSYTPEKDYLRFVALYIFLFAAVSDLLDGFVARHFQQHSKAGAVLDPLADKILLMSAFVCLYAMGNAFTGFHFPIWFIVILISRDVILMVGTVVEYVIRGDLDIVPSGWGKSTAFLESLCIVGFLLQLPLSRWLWPAVFVAACVSLFQYVYRGMKLLPPYGGKK
ncbi:MAG: CDP-alcohol phosphatidyltransferase family protein [Candidatus Omnitrophica bacterium]|nr:CDP-alcohol phosphatidyltransferase family protein [Candidatus Omnitrophota bacterium]